MKKDNHRKRNNESHISQIVNVISLFIECFGVTLVFEGSFLNFNLMGKESNAHLSLLMNMFGNPEMQAKTYLEMRLNYFNQNFPNKFIYSYILCSGCFSFWTLTISVMHEKFCPWSHMVLKQRLIKDDGNSPREFGLFWSNHF